MCGFVGGTLIGGNYRRGIEAIRHRGPDDQQIWKDERVTLAFARLAIVDLDHRSSQPMHSPDGRVTIVFNGEIYGYQSLRDRLQGLGHQFRTTSDTEVLLHAYLQWGNGFVEHIDGMFAIAIYDQIKDQIQLWRDRVGIKPLYYFWNGKDFVFGSEIKAILSTLTETPKPRLDAYYDFLTYQYIPCPKTSFDKISQLRPAHSIRLDVSAGRLGQPTSYWRLETEPDLSLNVSSTSKLIHEHIHASVGQQLIADVPVGCFLSGGIDSSIVTYEAASHSDNLQTFSIGFEGHDDELPFANAFASQLKTDHHPAVAPPSVIDLDRLRGWFDEPFADASAFPTHQVAKHAKARVKVALSGDGGDELFGGYSWYEKFQERLTRPEAFFRWCERSKQAFGHHTVLRRSLNLISSRLAPPMDQYTKLTGRLTDSEKHKYRCILEIDDDYDAYWGWREFWREDLPARTRLQYLDFHRYLPDDLLTKVDRTSMSESLEVRVPLLATKVVELAFRIPESLRYASGLKGGLRNAYRGRIGNEILDRTKRGFGIPRNYLPTFSAYRPAMLLSECYGVNYPPGFIVATSPSAAKET